MEFRRLPLVDISPPRVAVRVEIDEERLLELAQSIKSVGLLNPIIVEPKGKKWEVVAGHRRWMASNRAKLAIVPCMVLAKGEKLSAAAKLHENLFREDISPAEEAAFYAELYEELGKDVDAVANLVHRSRGVVEDRLLLLSGNPDVLAALASKRIALGVAIELNRLKKPEDVTYYLNWTISQGATRAMVHGWVESANVRAEFCGSAPPPAVEPAPVATTAAAEPVCFICGTVEPRHDVEFWYIHRSCRVIAERNRVQLEERLYGKPSDRGGAGEVAGAEGENGGGPGAGR